MRSAEEVARRHGGYRSGSGWICHCPVAAHGRGRGDRNPSLSVADGRQGLLVKCFAGCNALDVLAALGWTHRGYGAPWSRRPGPNADAGAVANTARALSIWEKRQPPAGTVVESYWSWRGINGTVPPSIGFASELWHAASGQNLPAMVAAVQDVAGRVMGIHRTYLRAGGRGKADVSPAKMALGLIAGGAVRVGPAAAELVVGEGIESSASAGELMCLPAWAALSTSGMRALMLPETVKTLWIAADPDGPGMAAAYALAERAKEEGRRVIIARPPKSTDFNTHAKRCNEYEYRR